MLKKWVLNRPIISFIVLTYALTITVWSVIIGLFGRVSIDTLFASAGAIPLIYLGAGAPAIVAIVLTALTKGKPGLKDLGRRFLRVRVNLWVWILAIGIPFGIAFACVAIVTIFSDQLGTAALPVWYKIVPPWILILFIAGPLCEETGWRGYLQPHLLAQFNPVTAILVLGVVWCFWHIPLSFTPNTTPELSTITAWGLYCLSSIATTSIMMAIVVAGRGSIFIAMIFHWASNAALGQVVMPLYPEASNDIWKQVELVQLGLTVVAAILAIRWLLSTHKRQPS